MMTVSEQLHSSKSHYFRLIVTHRPVDTKTWESLTKAHTSFTGDDSFGRHASSTGALRTTGVGKPGACGPSCGNPVGICRGDCGVPCTGTPRAGSCDDGVPPFDMYPVAGPSCASPSASASGASGACSTLGWKALRKRSGVISSPRAMYRLACWKL